MSGKSDELLAKISVIADKAIRNYAQELLSCEEVTRQTLQEWQRIQVGDDYPSQGLLTRITQRICSRALFEACHSLQPQVYNDAFANLGRILERSLRSTSYATILQESEHGLDDVVQQTLTDLHAILTNKASAGPDDPAAFLKWTQTILIRHAFVAVQKWRRFRCQYHSLDAYEDNFKEQFVDTQNTDPQERLVVEELQGVLKDAILSLGNPHYQQVLLYTYLGDMDERELAQYLKVQVQDIYRWRCRALKALRNNPDIMRVLRLWNM